MILILLYLVCSRSLALVYLLWLGLIPNPSSKLNIIFVHVSLHLPEHVPHSPLVNGLPLLPGLDVIGGLIESVDHNVPLPCLPLLNSLLQLELTGDGV